MWGADRNYRPEGNCLASQDFAALNLHVWFFFLQTFRFPKFYFKSSIHYHT